MRLIICIWIIVPGLIFCQSTTPPLSADRPDQTEAPYVVPQKSFQIETGIILANDKPERNVSITTNDLATTLLRYGLTDGIELRLSGGYIQQTTDDRSGSQTESGFAGIRAGSKFHLLEENGLLPETALIADLTIPTGNVILTENEYIPGLVFAASNSITDWASISYNLGARYRTNQKSVYIYTLSLGIQPLKKIGIFAEIFGSFSQKNTPRHSIDFGMTYLVIRNLQLDTTYGFAITENAVDSFFNFGLSWRLPQ